MSKITIIGAGNVGSAIAYSLHLVLDIDELVLIDIDKEKAEGEAMDISQGVLFRTQCVVRSGDYEDAKGSDIVIMAAGVARKAGQTRLTLAKTNVMIFDEIMPRIAMYAKDAIYIVVTNPVDILTYYVATKGGIDKKRVIGTGTILDTSRLYTLLRDRFKLDIKDINAMVLGEHGDSSFIPWSHIRVEKTLFDSYLLEKCNLSIDEIKKLHDFMEDTIHKAGENVISKKGVSVFASTMTVCKIVYSILNDTREKLTISSVLDGEYGIKDVSLSTVCSIGREGIISREELELSSEELEALNESSDKLKSVIKDVIEDI